MTAPVTRVLGVLILAGGVLSAAGQDVQKPTFSSESDLVVLHVNVFDRRGDSIPKLEERFFHVLENDVPQTITFFSGEDAPVAVGLLVDSSSSMLTRRAMVLAGIKAFAASTKTEDEVFTILFNEEVRRGLPATVAFTHNPSLLEASVISVPVGGKTAFHDAVIAGLEHLDRAEKQKHALVVLSDGEDNASRHTEAEMLRRAEQSNALIYAVSTARLDAHVGNDGLMKKLAHVTGGVAYRPQTEADVVTAFSEIGKRVREGYSLGYVPTNAVHDGTYRRIQVRVGVPGVRPPTVHVREGYIAPLHDDGR